MFAGGDWRSADLSGCRFVDCSFQAVAFRSTCLRDAVFERCRFYENEQACEFRYAELREAGFTGCDLTTANFERANLHGVELHRCQAQGASFVQADFTLSLSRTRNLVRFLAEGCNLAYSDFSQIHLPGGCFSDCRLVHASFNHADLSGAALTDCDLSNLEAQGLTLAGADLRGARFNNLDPRGIDLTGARVTAEQALLLIAAMDIEIDPGR